MQTPTYTALAYADGTRWRAAVQIDGIDIWISRGRFGSYATALDTAASRARALRGDHRRQAPRRELEEAHR